MAEYGIPNIFVVPQREKFASVELEETEIGLKKKKTSKVKRPVPKENRMPSNMSSIFHP